MTSRPLHRLAQSAIRQAGRQTIIDEDIPSAAIAGEMISRGVQLLRGYARLQSPVFLGRDVTLQGRRGLVLGHGVSIADRCLIDARSRAGVQLGRSSRLGRYGTVTTTSHLSRLGQGFTLGERSGLGDFFHVGASGGVTIGDDVIVGPFFTVHSQEHLFEDPQLTIREQGTRESAVCVEDDCWIGARVTLLAGTHLRSRTIVAAGSVVRGEHPEGVVLAGAPARVVRTLDGAP